MKNIRQEREKAIVVRTRQYDNRLAGFERQLTQFGKLEQALIVHQERNCVRAVIESAEASRP